MVDKEKRKMICADLVCNECKHQHSELYDGWRVACDAYPKGGIPKEILFYANIGDEIISNCANGIGFEPKEKEDEK